MLLYCISAYAKILLITPIYDYNIYIYIDSYDSICINYYYLFD